MTKRRLAYFDCFSGISGDMTLGALIDLGVSPAWLKGAIEQIPLGGFDLVVETVVRGGIQARQVNVVVEEGAPSRNYADIRDLIGSSPLAPGVMQKSLAAFDKIAEAEAGIHGCEKESVHFHEVGGVDAIVDIVGAMLCMDYLGIDEAAASPLPLGNGFVVCQHGTLPVPAPATLKILKNIPVRGSDVSRELVTPTGAAIITTLTGVFGPIPEMLVGNSGYGAGQADTGSVPNLLRVITGELPIADNAPVDDRVSVVETCIDDMNPEVFGYVMDRLFAEGALDVYWIPAYMKKNRPGTLVQVLCPLDRRDRVIRCLLSETTSLGVRHHIAGRKVLAREPVAVQTPYGEVAAKRVIDPDGNARTVPEYEECKRVALEKKVPIRQVYEAVTCHDTLQDRSDIGRILDKNSAK